MKSANIWMLITGIVVIVSGFLLYSTIRSKETEKAQFMVKLQEMAGRVNQLEKLQGELEALKKEKTELEARHQEEIASFEGQIGDAKKAESQAKAKVESLQREKESLTKYIENNNAIVAKLNKKIETLEKARNAAEANIKKLEDEDSAPPKFVDPMTEEPPAIAAEPKENLGAKLAEEELVDLGRIIIHPSTQEAARVEHVNALYGFIVLSAGTNDGLEKDTVVNITRNNRLIAKAVIKKAREDVSSAVTLPEWTREEIRVGDMISINSPSPLPSL